MHKKMPLESIHHLCATSRGGTNDPRNIPRIRHKVHEALHTIFGNELPHEQIESILQLSEDVLKPVYKERIREVNRTVWAYQKGILRKK